MTIGYVQQKERKKGEEVIKWFEMSIRVPFGSCTVTMAKRKPREGEAENAPDFELWFSPNRKGESFDRMKVGSLWKKISERGNTYLSGYIESPMILQGKMYISVVKYVHQEGMPLQPILYNVLWSPIRSTSNEGQGDMTDTGGYVGGYAQPAQEGYTQEQPAQGNQMTAPNGAQIEIDMDEIPF